VISSFEIMTNRQKIFLIILLLCISGLSGFIISYYLHKKTITTDDKAISFPQTYHTPISFVKQLQGDPNAGEKIYKEYCASCHAEEAIIDVPAPKINDPKAMQKLRKKGIAKLLKTTLHGKGAMPARGGCFECSDQQLLQAIHYLIK